MRTAVEPTRSWRTIGVRAMWGSVAAGVVTLLLIGGYWLWFSTLRGQPDEVQRTLFEGIAYERIVITEPIPVVVHRVVVSVDAPGLGFLVTPPDPLDGRVLRGQTVGAFLERHDLKLAINGDFFQPWHSNMPWDYYPRVGEPVDPLGFAASNGTVYAEGSATSATLFISCGNAPSFERPDDLCEAISGAPLLSDGRIVAIRDDGVRHPRTAVGLDAGKTRLIILVVDGRQPGYSEGMTLPELGDQMLAAGARDAINLDGGGSSALVIEGDDGEAEVVSSPIHTRIVGRQRPIANHLGIHLR
jgi:hypothetical protein